MASVHNIVTDASKAGITSGSNLVSFVLGYVAGNPGVKTPCDDAKKTCEVTRKVTAATTGSNESMACHCPHHCKAMVGPSLLASDLADMAKYAAGVIEDGADYLHIDVMDGHFVPNISWGPPVIKSLREHIPAEDALFDCHMMVSDPLFWVKAVADACKSNAMFTFHLEAVLELGQDPKTVISAIRRHGMRVGIAIKPGTGVDAVRPFVPAVDMVLVMTVEPGFGGQKFMIDMMPKIVALRNEFEAMHIEVDGGLTPGNAHHAARAGANMIVAGSSVFKKKETDEDGHTVTRFARSGERRTAMDLIRGFVTKNTVSPLISI